MSSIVEMCEIKKNFGGVHALRGVSLSIAGGEVVALLGHNGAGKSVLVQILSGVFPQSGGDVTVDGAPVQFRSPQDARRARIETIYQTLALAENLNGSANFFLGRELKTRFGFLDKKKMEEIATKQIHILNPNFTNSSSLVRDLSGGQRQAIAIARAVYFNARVLIMDEPTAALGPYETTQVAETIRGLKAKGLGILLVSHDLDDVFELADRVVVLKNGHCVGEGKCKDLTRDEVLKMIIDGQPIEQAVQVPADG